MTGPKWCAFHSGGAREPCLLAWLVVEVPQWGQGMDQEYSMLEIIEAEHAQAARCDHACHAEACQAVLSLG